MTFATLRLPGSPRRGSTSSVVPIGNAIATPDLQAPSPLARGIALFLATAGGAGLAPVAPGTVGSAVAVLLFLPLASLPPWLYGITGLALVFLGIWAADAAERIFQRHDDGRIVIDEVAGQLIALAPLLATGHRRSLPWLVTGFVLFRVFDIWKPGPVRRLERVSGGAGVMLDDVAAGALAAGVLAALLLGFARLGGGS